MTVDRFRCVLATLLLSLATAVSTYAASSYKVTFPMEVSVADAKLKSGAYTITLDGKDAVFTKGKEVIRIPVAVDKNLGKFSDTTVEMSGSTVQAIDLGGTNTRLVFRLSH